MQIVCVFCCFFEKQFKSYFVSIFCFCLLFHAFRMYSWKFDKISHFNHDKQYFVHFNGILINEEFCFFFYPSFYRFCWLVSFNFCKLFMDDSVQMGNGVEIENFWTWFIYALVSNGILSNLLNLAFINCFVSSALKFDSIIIDLQ